MLAAYPKGSTHQVTVPVAFSAEHACLASFKNTSSTQKQLGNLIATEMKPKLVSSHSMIMLRPVEGAGFGLPSL